MAVAGQSRDTIMIPFAFILIRIWCVCERDENAGRWVPVHSLSMLRLME